jgi:hypothetical protein
MKHKNYFLIVICTFIVLFLKCAVNKKIMYELPKEMLQHVKIGYAKQCDKGKILYDINCAKCHTIIVKRKEIIPDFKEDQLRGYELRVVNAKHEASLPDEQVTEEELGLIMTFLRYKKRNTIIEKK